MNKIRTHFLALLAVMLMGTGAAYAVDYGIYVGETMITSSNASNILGNGKFSYNASTKTLTVNNATLTNTGTLGSGISNREVDGLIIKLVGTNTFNTRMNCISSYKNISFTGSGTLNATSSNGHGLALYSENTAATCSFNGPTVNLTASSGYAVYDYYGTSALKFIGANTRVTLNASPSRQTVYNLKNLTVSDGLRIVYPQSASFNSSLKTVASNGTPCKGTVAIGITYGLYIGETMVTSYNYNDVNGDGMFAYRPNLKTLDVRSGTFTNTGSLGSGIDNREVDGLTIHLTGSLINITTRNSPIYSEKSLSITGPGTLNATSNSGPGLRFGGSAAMTCTIGEDSNGNSPTLNLKGSSYGIEDYYSTTELVVKGESTVNMQPGSGYVTVKNLKKLSMGSGVTITEPTWGSFDANLKSIKAYHANEAYKGKISIGKSYPLYVGGMTVTPQNASGITGNGISGTVTYNASTKSLTLRNATITTGDDFNPIQNQIDGLNIIVEGTNNIDCTGNGLQLLCLQASTKISGSGTLNLKTNNNNYCARVFGGSTLTIEGPTVNGSTAIEALAFYPGDSESLVINGSSTKVTLKPGEGRATIQNLTNFTLGSGLYITEPAGAKYSSSLKSITLDGTTPYSGEVVISNESPTYNIWIGTTKATPENANDILGNGQFKYDPSTNTLTLKNVNYSQTNGNTPILLGIEGLKVKVEGTNSITANTYVVGISKSLTFTGTGSLTITTDTEDGVSGIALWAGDGTEDPHTINCTFDGPKVTIVSPSGSAFSASYYDNNAIIVKGSTTMLDMQPYSATSGNGALYLIDDFRIESDNLYYLEPTGVKFDTNKKQFTVDGQNKYYGRVVVGPEIDYGIYVAETKVMTHNVNDILGDGSFSYDPSTKVLTVRNAYLENTGTLGSGISNREVEGLAINIEGNNTFNTRMAVIGSEQPFVIIGTGTLNGTSREGYGLWLVSEKALFCAIHGPTLNLSSGNSVIGDWQSTATLFIYEKGTQVNLNPGIGRAAIYNLNELALDTCLQITEPAGAWFSDNLKSITTDGSTPYCGTVTIGGKSSDENGDMNGDGKVDMADIATVISAISSPEGFVAVDVNGDGYVNVADIVAIIKTMVKQAKQQKMPNGEAGE